MKLTKCSNGHFYDSEMYSSCPHCAGGGAAMDEGKTVPFADAPGSEDKETMDLDAYGSGVGAAPAPVDEDDNKTISIYQSKKAVESGAASAAPTVGWLVCTKGKFYGQDFRLKSGRNFIGRSTMMDICLSGENSVSRDRHATIIHEPRKNIFIAQPGESRELFYINGNVVLSPVQMKKNDVMQVGDVQLMLIPCCDEAFNWELD
ncbi:MAG: FHA domain-containing protein [Clostridiales bacterium]|nr:FHA domain-containing protein [Clostridiales bacterium]